MKHVLYSFLLIPCFLWSQNNLTIHVHNIPSSAGSINVAVYGSEKTFLTYDGAIKADRVSAHKGKLTLILEDLPEGEYALAVFHDKNENKKVDTNWLGIPTEKVGFSKGKIGPFGPPRYKDCTFTLISDDEIDIVL